MCDRCISETEHSRIRAWEELEINRLDARMQQVEKYDAGGELTPEFSCLQARIADVAGSIEERVELRELAELERSNEESRKKKLRKRQR